MPSAVVLVAAVGLAGCYVGSARDISPRVLAVEPGWTAVHDVPFVPQREDADCGAAALAMVLKYWAVDVGIPLDAEHGIKAGRLRDRARDRGLEAYLFSGDLRDLSAELVRGHPVVVGLAKPIGGGRALAHYEVVIGMHREKRLILTLDPAAGWRENSFEGFAREWIPTGRVTLVVFPPAPSPPPPAPRA